MKRICVYCGSSPGNNELYLQTAEELGQVLALNNVGLVYGGASVGLMGRIADSVMKHGGEVIGIIPGHLKKEVAHYGLTSLHEVNTMHERKKMMMDLSDAMIAMPGGLGTMEEIFEAATWSQLQLHTKPCGLLNVNGYYDKLLEFIDHAVNEGFILPRHRYIMQAAETPTELLDKLKSVVEHA
ncbi:MAG: TIGR00730 family Rossman fold protein [Victivallales bacterium]|nr:TIGR00730 family Rossman fold protein [Victivallales bacterium]